MAEDVYKKLCSSDCIYNEEGLHLDNSTDTVSIDTWNYGSFPFSVIVGFDELLESLVPDLLEKAVIERYIYNDGYYKHELDPENNTATLIKVSDEDPYES